MTSGYRSDRGVRRPEPGAEDVQNAALRYLMYAHLPAWFVPGLLDWWMHRRTRIERTSGIRESLVHSVMMAEVGAPLIMALLLEVNPPVLASMFASVLLHEGTAMADVKLATNSPREVRRHEQHVHSFLEAMPFMAAAAMASMYPQEVRQLVHPTRGATTWRLRLKKPPLPRRYIVGIFAAVGAFGVLPYAEELYRCWRARPRRFDSAKCKRRCGPAPGRS